MFSTQGQVRALRAFVLATIALATVALAPTAASAARLPNDTYVDSAPRDGRWDGSTRTFPNAWGQPFASMHYLQTIRADRAWRTTKGAGIVIAGIDTGLDENHPDINDNLYVNSREIPGNGRDDDRNGFADDVHGWDFAVSSSFPPIVTDDDGEATGCDTSPGAAPCKSRPGEDNHPHDRNGHGTAVAGVFSAEQDNGIGISGVAPQAKVLPLRATVGTSSSTIDLTGGINSAGYIANNPDVDVVNLSAGFNNLLSGAGGPILCGLVDDMLKQGKIFVAGAGNGADNDFPALPMGGPDNGNPHDGFSPASCPNAISATSVAQAKTSRATVRSPYANFTSADAPVTIAAPGGGGTICQPGNPPSSPGDRTGYANNDILTLKAAGTSPVRDLIAGDGPNNCAGQSPTKKNITDAVTVGSQYLRWRGTSFATPQVTGTVALMLAASPGLQSLPACSPNCTNPTSFPKVDKVRSILQRSAKRLKDQSTGGHLLNADAAVKMARRVR